MTRTYATYTYKTHYYCARGCGSHKGWLLHGEEKLSKNGYKMCPFCGNHIRTVTRSRFGSHRKEEPERL